MITDAPAAFIQSIGATENHVVLVVWQADLALSGLKTSWTRNILEVLAPWDRDRDRQTFFYVLNRFTGEPIGKHTSGPMVTFYHINAQEDSVRGDLVIDMATYADHSFLSAVKRR